MTTASTYGVHSIDDGCRSVGLLAVVDPGLLGHQCPQLVQVDGGAVGGTPLQMVMSHTHLAEVPRMAEKSQGGKTKMSLKQCWERLRLDLAVVATCSQ